MSSFAQYIADALTSHIAGETDSSDFVLRQGEDDITYVDPEEGEVFLITVKKARFVPASEEKS
jgi:hypothetical protein